MDPRIDRLRGSLFGLAVGDALGAAVEFKPPGAFPPVTGYRGGGPFNLHPGEWTDDTAMALALADSIARAGWNLDDQATRYRDWQSNGRYSVNGRCFDIGVQTRDALHRFSSVRDARLSGNPAESKSGNGSIMRLAPVVVAYAGHFPDQVELLLDHAEDSSLPTHPSPICRSACRYLALILAALAHGLPRDAVLDPRWPMLESLGRVHPAVQTIVDGSYGVKHPPAIRGGGYVVDSLEAALWGFHDAADFREAVLRAVNLGDDADTTGAVCGQIAGAFWGELGIPGEWRAELARADMIETALHALLDRDHTPLDSAGGPEHGSSRDAPNGAVTAMPPERSYWLLPGKLLAGCYPSDRDSAERDRKIGRLLDVGIRTFINLCTVGERHLGHPLAEYESAVEELSRERGIRTRCLRHPITDLGVPTVEDMRGILLAMDGALEDGAVYMHCLGGIGRTGTVSACWLLTHGQATAENVIEKLARLREMDRERGHMQSPETGAQRRFVLQWAEENRRG